MQLASLLEEARTASPASRIEWRDGIAAFGLRAIEAVQPWLSHSVLAAFAIRVIERAGAASDPKLAARVLRAARADVPPAAAGDIDWALTRLKAASHAPEATPTALPVARRGAPAPAVGRGSASRPRRTR